jgi:molybdopterin molybdotransferase
MTHPHGHDGGGEPLWTVDEHLADVLAAVRPLPPQELPLLDAQGCRLADDLVAPGDLPPFDNSSMDGYAVRTADLEGAGERYPSVLTVVGDIAAGAAELPRVGPGECARIMTGAPMPPGAEAVVPVEWTDAGSGGGAADRMAPRSAGDDVTGTELRVFRPVGPGAFVRRRGDDVTAGQTVLPAGTPLGATQLGLAAAVGRATVRVRPRPRVVVLSTGSELVPPGTPVGPGRITDSNSFMLAAAARAAGAEPLRIGGVPDDAARLRAVLEEHLDRADAVVTSGGVSVGAYDVVKEALGDGALGSVDFRRLRMQPGKPQGFGLLRGTVPLFALPGNPVSAYISFELFVRPALRTMAGAAPVQRPVVRALLAEGLRSPEGRRQYARGRYLPPAPGAEHGTVEPVGGAGSHLVGPLAQADALIVVPEAETELKPGTLVKTVLLGD